MKLQLIVLRRLIREVLVNQSSKEEMIDEVDTDPSNNPGRPADAFDYIGMHPDPKAAMAHPAARSGSLSTTPK